MKIVAEDAPAELVRRRDRDREAADLIVFAQVLVRILF